MCIFTILHTYLNGETWRNPKTQKYCKASTENGCSSSPSGLWFYPLVSVLSDALVSGVSTFVATLLLLTIIAIGIVFDIIGIAVTAAEVKGFHAMGANRVPSADYAIALIRNADKVSNFCNDVIGDICGIVSGAVGTMIVFRILGSFGFINGTLLSVLFTGAISATTVGGRQSESRYR